MCNATPQQSSSLQYLVTALRRAFSVRSELLAYNNLHYCLAVGRVHWVGRNNSREQNFSDFIEKLEVDEFTSVQCN